MEGKFTLGGKIAVWLERCHMSSKKLFNMNKIYNLWKEVINFGINYVLWKKLLKMKKNY